MTKHQMTQGYAPSLASMFNGSMRAPSTSQSLLFVPDSSGTSLSTLLYPAGALPKPSTPVSPTRTSFYTQNPHYTRYSYDHTTPHPPSSYAPHTSRPTLTSSSKKDATENTRITRSVSTTDPVSRDPRPVTLPRECLPRFLSIAAANTARNRETCGLLLGKDKGRSFVVTTLLIPKQHSTSDTCTMDEEELVLKFTVERNLITLGWVKYFFK
jgi:STAM-binding protein